MTVYNWSAPRRAGPMKTRKSAANTGDTARTLRFYWRHFRTYPWRLAGAAVLLPVTILINGYWPTLILANVLGRLSAHKIEAGNIWASFGPQILLYVG